MYFVKNNGTVTLVVAAVVGIKRKVKCEVRFEKLRMRQTVKVKRYREEILEGSRKF